MKTYKATFNQLVKKMTGDIDFLDGKQLDDDFIDNYDLDVIEVWDNTCDMNFVVYLTGIRQSEVDKLEVSQYYYGDNDGGNVMWFDFEDIMNKEDKVKVIEVLEKVVGK